MLNALLPNLSHKYFIHQQLIHQTLSINILDRKKPLRSLSGFLCWCRQRDLNSHSLRPLPPQDSVSTNFTMSAFEKTVISAAEERVQQVRVGFQQERRA